MLIILLSDQPNGAILYMFQMNASKTSAKQGPFGQETSCTMLILWTFSMEEEQWTEQLCS